MDHNDPKLLEIWRQKAIPIIFRNKRLKVLLIRLPYADDNRDWLRGQYRQSPLWRHDWKCWQTPWSWFEDVAQRTLEKYRRVYVIQPYRESQKCAPACWNAVGAECECSCLGANHGLGTPEGKWHIVSETFAVSWEERKYSCRLLLPVDA